MASGPQDAESLKKEVENLKQLLRAANERIQYLENTQGASRAQAQISALRKQMLEKKMSGGAVNPNSKACVIS